MPFKLEFCHYCINLWEFQVKQCLSKEHFLEDSDVLFYVNPEVSKNWIGYLFHLLGDLPNTGIKPPFPETSAQPSGKDPGEGSGNSLWYFCLEKSIVRRAWWGTVYGVPMNRTLMSTHSLARIIKHHVPLLTHDKSIMYTEFLYFHQIYLGTI